MNFESKFLEFVARVKRVGLSALEIDDVIAWGGVYARVLSHNHSSLFRDDDFENCVIEKYQKIKSNGLQKNELTKELHVITEPFSSGGHTRLMEKMVLYRGNADVVVVRPYQTDRAKLRLPEGVNVFSRVEGYDLPGLIDVVSAYKTVYLHIHPDDLLGAAAVGVAKTIANSFVVFVNHADHIFSFGFASADVVAEVSFFGYRLSKERRGVISSFIGIPVDIDGIRDLKPPHPKEKLMILSAGRSLKFKPTRKLSFQSVIANVLTNVPNSIVTVVGPNLLRDWWWWWLKLRFINRLHIVGVMPYSEYLCVIDKTDVYLDSYPMTGGTALPEVRSKNIPVTGLLTGSSGYTPFDLTKFDRVEGLVDALNSLRLCGASDIVYANNDGNIISLARLIHGKEEFNTRVSKIIGGELVYLPEADVINIDIDFYRENWLKSKVVFFVLSDIRFFLLNFLRHGRGILFNAFFGFGKKQVFSCCGRLFS